MTTPTDFMEDLFAYLNAESAATRPPGRAE